MKQPAHPVDPDFAAGVQAAIFITTPCANGHRATHMAVVSLRRAVGRDGHEHRVVYAGGRFDGRRHVAVASGTTVLLGN